MGLSYAPQKWFQLKSSNRHPLSALSFHGAVHGCILELLNKKLENQKWVSRRGNVLSSFTTKAASLEVRFKAADAGDWKLWKYVDEAQIGPGPPINSVFVREKLVNADQNLQETCKWMSVESCLTWLQEVKPRCERVGPLIVAGLPNEFAQTRELQIPSTLPYQEYPPGVVLVPMASRTGKPFRTTNLVVFAPKNVPNDSEKNGFIACGDALIVDLGCQSKFHEEALDKSKYMNGLRAVRKHIQKLKLDLELLKAHAKRKVEFSSDAIEETSEDIESVESGSSSDSNEAMRTSKTLK